jgi:hypothetical protein
MAGGKFYEFIYISCDLCRITFLITLEEIIAVMKDLGYMTVKFNACHGLATVLFRPNLNKTKTQRVSFQLLLHTGDVAQKSNVNDLSHIFAYFQCVQT